jgi:SET domain-containing protein
METEHLIFKPSTIDGIGAFAKHAISAGTRVIDYLGETITKEESLRRCTQDNRCIFHLNATQDLDGAVGWNPARFINHSCEPNCDAICEAGCIWMVSIRGIGQGEEVTFNYAYDLEDYRRYPCDCGSASCVGFIVAEEFFEHVREHSRVRFEGRNISR